MEELLLPAPKTLSEAPRARTTFGSLVSAMALGAFIAVALLYFWGAQVAKEEGLTGAPAEQQ